MIWEAAVVLGVTVALIVWDVFLAADRQRGNTISEIISKASKKWWVCPYAWGVLGGHWFLNTPFDIPQWVTIASLTLALGGGIVAGAYGTRVPRWIALGVGFVHGWLIWGQGG